MHCGIVILAAGSSSRLGEPKQLLPYKGRSLLWQAAQTAMATGLQPVVVVVGANSGPIKSELEGMTLNIVENSLWKEGMSTSIKTGLDAAMESDPQLDAIIFMVCDQPFVSTEILEELVKVGSAGSKTIVASRYQENLGTPALFTRSVFPALLELKGDTGARKLIKQHEADVAVVDFPEGAIDIDTKKDYETFIQGEQWKKN